MSEPEDEDIEYDDVVSNGDNNEADNSEYVDEITSLDNATQCEERQDNEDDTICTFEDIDGQLLLTHQVCKLPCMCSQEHDSWTGWAPNLFEDSSKFKRPKRRPKFPYRLAYSTYREPKYVFRHYKDTSKYMDQYRYHHTRGDVCKEPEEPLILGYNVPDPYKPKLHRFRFLFETLDAAIAGVKPVKTSFADSEESDSEESQNSAALGRKAVTVNLAPTRHHQTGCDRQEGVTLPKIDQGSTKMTEKRKAEQRRSIDIKSDIVQDIQRYQYASLSLPVHLVEDYRGFTGRKHALPPSLTRELHHIGYNRTPSGRPMSGESSASVGSSRSVSMVSTDGRHGNEAFNQAKDSNKPIPYRLWKLSPGTSLQDYLAHIYSIRSTGSLVLGSTVGDRRDGLKGCKRGKDKKELPMRIGLCTFYSSGNDTNEATTTNSPGKLLGVEGKSTGTKERRSKHQTAQLNAHINAIRNGLHLRSTMNSRRVPPSLSMNTVITGNQYRTEEGHRAYLAQQRQTVPDTTQ
ncbi:uncharacterized protein LOC144449259 [Glandiceps talaboti]